MRPLARTRRYGTPQVKRPAPTADDLEAAADVLDHIPGYSHNEPWTGDELRGHASHLRELENARARKVKALADFIRDCDQGATSTGLADQLDAAGWIVDAIPTVPR